MRPIETTDAPPRPVVVAASMAPTKITAKAGRRAPAQELTDGIEQVFRHAGSFKNRRPMKVKMGWDGVSFFRMPKIRAAVRGAATRAGGRG